MCARNSEQILAGQMDMQTGYGIMWCDVGLILALTLAFHIAAYFALRKRSAIKRLTLPNEHI